MTTPPNIEALANERLEDARSLADAGRCNAAFYMVGYAVELGLKARVCKNLDVPDLYGEQQMLADPFFQTGTKKLARFVRTHDLFLLIVLSGLLDAYLSINDPDLLVAKALFVNNWSESYRYAPHPLNSDQDVKDLIHIIGKPQDGLLA